MLQDEAGWYSCTSCIVDVEHGDGKWATMLETCQSTVWWLAFYKECLQRWHCCNVSLFIWLLSCRQSNSNLQCRHCACLLGRRDTQMRTPWLVSKDKGLNTCIDIF